MNNNNYHSTSTYSLSQASSYSTPGNPLYDNSTSSTSTSTSTRANDQQLGSPVVFSCASCRTLLGDSYGWVDANNICILLSAVCNISVSPTVEWCTIGSADDFGGSYHRLACTTCQQNIGKYYKSTPPHLDEFRDRYALYIEKIAGYELGTSDIQSD